MQLLSAISISTGMLLILQASFGSFAYGPDDLRSLVKGKRTLYTQWQFTEISIQSNHCIKRITSDPRLREKCLDLLVRFGSADRNSTTPGLRSYSWLIYYAMTGPLHCFRMTTGDVGRNRWKGYDLGVAICTRGSNKLFSFGEVSIFSSCPHGTSYSNSRVIQNGEEKQSWLCGSPQTVFFFRSLVGRHHGGLLAVSLE